MLTNFDGAATAKGVFYGGDAGAKDAIMLDGGVWMIKFPKTTRDLMNPQISYTTSPLSEYLGSKIYEHLGIPVHETILGVRKNKVVVACKDFTRGPNGELVNLLIPFHDLKNSFMSSDLESYSGTGSETRLDEVLATLAGQEELKSMPGVTERFWDMFVVDAFIGNNDRNNGNWGILFSQRSKNATLAPVFDNGNAFFNKRSLAQMEKRLNDETSMYEDACLTPVCAYKYAGLDNEGQRINPFTFIKSGENPHCNSAVSRFVHAVDMDAISEMIFSIPEVSGNRAVMPIVQKEFYQKLLQIRFENLRN